jgi:thiamine pyrophosphate-dependent acetolactate synthase large subunit-like protein
VGIFGIRVTDPGDLEGALREALNHPGPALVDAVVNRQELSLPPKVTLEQMKGFSLYMVKAVMNGRGDEVLDLARSNWLRP